MKQRPTAEKKVSDSSDIPTGSTLPIADDMLLSMIPKDKLLQLASRLNNYLEKELHVPKEQIYGEGFTVPVSIFSKELSPLEALVKFLKENADMTYHKIGVTIGRDERGIWVTYRNAKRKMPSQFAAQDKDILIPLKIFTDQMSILEALVSYLRDTKEMRGTEIADLLNKSTSTIWTVYNRSKEKSKQK